MIDGRLSRRLADLAARREAMLAQSAALRRRVATAAGEFHPALTIIERVVAAIRYLRSHPWLAGLAAAGAVAVVRKGIVPASAAGIAWRFAARWLI